MISQIADRVDARNGRWYQTDGGVWIPSVTTVVGVYPKPQLMDWYGVQPSLAEANRIRDEAAAWGTLIHDSAYLLLNGEEVDVSGWEEPAAVKKLLGFKRWMEEVKPDILAVEFGVTDGVGIAGTCDLVVTTERGRGIIDIKTSGDVYPSHHIQVAAYRLAANAMEIDVDWCGILHLKSTTKKGWQFVETVSSGPVSHEVAYAACLTLFKHLYGNEPDLGSREPLPTKVKLEVLR